MRRRRLFRKYVVVFVSLVAGTLLISGAIEIYFSYQENKDALVALQREKASSAAVRIERFVKEIESQIGWTTQPQLSTPDAALEQRRIDFLRLLRQVPAITELSHLDGSGREQLRVSRLAMDTVGSNADWSNDPKFLEAKSRKTYYGPVYFRKESEPYMSISMAQSGGGVTVAEVNLKFIWDVVSQIKIGKAGRAFVVDGGGILIADPDISLVLQKTSLASLEQVTAATFAAAGSPRRDVTIGRDLQGRRVLTAHASIAPLRWSVFAEQPLEEAFAPLRASIERTVVLVLIGVALSVIGSMLLARRMVQPIRALQEGAAKIGAGDLGQRLEVQTSDELEDLAQQFNRMTEQLQESYATLEQKVEQRTRDLTEALERNQALLREVEEKTRELEVASRHKSEFLANMSHELRTPLNAVIGFSEVLLERMFGELNDKQEEYLHDILGSGRHLLSLINDILDLSKIEAGRLELELGEFDLPQAIDNALTLVRERASRRSISLSVDVEAGVATIRADQRKVKQVLLNLLSNAVKFTGEGGHVAVRATRADGMVEVSVTDTGVGIAPEDHAIIFEEFRQVGSDYARKQEGTGLGLALARKLVELHGGTIWVKSHVGEGATFTFTLPVTACPAS
ncbi:MAG TPA: ATP-binding protein [Methylomirabilota bacterium]|jgi:signal transduction histidine kinase